MNAGFVNDVLKFAERKDHRVLALAYRIDAHLPDAENDKKANDQ